MSKLAATNHSCGVHWLGAKHETRDFGNSHGRDAIADIRTRFGTDAIQVWGAGNDAEVEKIESSKEGFRGYNLDYYNQYVAHIGETCDDGGTGFYTASSCTAIGDAKRQGADFSNIIVAGTVEAGNMVAGEILMNDFIVASGVMKHVDPAGEDKGWYPYSGIGTSLAAPRVSGVAALVKQKFPNLDGAGIKQSILQGAIDIGAPGVDKVYGHGLLSAAGALSPVGAFN